MMFIPIGTFLVIYYLFLTNQISPSIQSELVERIILIAFPILAVLDLTIVHLVVRKKFSLLNKEISLGVRLEKYFSVAVIRLSDRGDFAVYGGRFVFDWQRMVCYLLLRIGNLVGASMAESAEGKQRPKVAWR